MNVLRSLPIKHKLMVIVIITTSIALVSMAILISINEALSERQSIEKQLQTLAEVIGSRSTADITFNDDRSARENLSALAAKGNIERAFILLDSGAVFAEYRPRFAELSPKVNAQGEGLIPKSNLLFNSKQKIYVAREIRLEGDAIGSIHIISNMNEFYDNLRYYVSLMVVAVLMSSLVSLSIGARLQRLISRPITRLHNAMHKVSDSKDYSIRVSGGADDELGKLINGFNDMLQQIQMRDAELARYSANLEEEVAARVAELSDVNRQRISWLESLARFLRHELQNATAGVKTSLELIKRRTQDEKTEELLHRARKSILYMNTLIDSVGNASSLEASLYQDQHISIDFSRFVKECYEDYQTVYVKHQFTLQCDPGISVKGDKNRLRQMLDKLISNAIEHANAEDPIRIGLTRRENDVVLTVENYGATLPVDKERMFELFVSMRDAQHSGKENIGLGLYVVKLVAESHGGHVQALDQTDKVGAIFKVTLPLH